MRRWKAALLKCIPLISGELFAFLTLDILWTMLELGPPFSLPIYLAAGILVVLVNDRFLRRRRTIQAILFVNIALCFVWGIPLGMSLERSNPVLLMFQLPLFVLPPLLGWKNGTTSITPQRMQSCSEMTGLYSLFYLIVASFVPELLPKAFLILGVLILDLWISARLRTAGRNTIQMEGTLGRLPTMLLPVLAAVGTGVLCLLLALGQNGILTVFHTLGEGLLYGLQSFFQLWMAFAQRMSSQETQTSEFSFGDGSAVGQFPVTETRTSLPPELGMLLAGFLLAGMVLFILAVLIHWYRRNRKRTRMLAEEEDVEREARHRPRGLHAFFAGILRHIRLWIFLLQNRGSPGAALIQLERWGNRHRCRRRSAETPREYLERLGIQVIPFLTGEQQKIYFQLIQDIEGNLYGGTSPILQTGQVQSLLKIVHRGKCLKS